MKKIILTGGGTAGHVNPNIALIPELKKLGYAIYYIGSKNGIEKKLVQDASIPYYSISSGKLRRYFDFKNVTDIFRIFKGCFDSFFLIRKIKPDVVFSKGGFVSVPVVFGAFLSRVPCVIHESDMTPGLANKLSFPFATKICCSFSDTLKYLPNTKAVLTGSPIRQELLAYDIDKGKFLCGFNDNKPVLLVIGGSLGSKNINEVVRNSLDSLLKCFNIVHICGNDNIDKNLLSTSGYSQFEYVKDDLRHLFGISDVVVSRAGANAVFELLQLKKPSLLIPLSANASRGDQILNANSFVKHGYSRVLYEEALSSESLVKEIGLLYDDRESFISNMSHSKSYDGVGNVVKVIDSVVK